MVSCRVCLAECEKFKIFNEIDESISYLDMIKIVANIFVESEDILCTTCSSELITSYNFLIKVRLNFLKKNECLDEKIKESLKDPLEDSSDEDNFAKDTINLNIDKTTIFKDSTSDDEKDNHFTFNEESSSSDKCDGELLLNNLSDLNVSPENLIFPRGRFKCSVCDKNYFTSTGLSAHQEVHLPKSPSKKKKRRRQHKKKALSDDVNETEINTTEAVTDLEANAASEKITTTQRKEKEPKQKKTFPCQVCGKQMISASKLRYHMVMHTGEKDFLCSMCPKAYSTIYALKHHFRSHSGDRPYECKFCGDRFYRPTTLKSHVRRHTGERPYGCEICGKRFIQHSSMTTHIKLNHMDKTIPCPHCDKKYARQTDLNTHLLSHSGDKPFSCQLCPSRFIRQANLNKHMNQHHAQNQKNAAA